MTSTTTGVTLSSKKGSIWQPWFRFVHYLKAGQGATEFGNGRARAGYATFEGPLAWMGNVVHRGGENRSPDRARVVLFFTLDNVEADLAIEDNPPFVL